MLTKPETAFVWVYSFGVKARKIYLKTFWWIAVVGAIAFECAVKAEIIALSAVFPVAITYTILALIYIICVLIEREEKRKNRLRHRADRR